MFTDLAKLSHCLGICAYIWLLIKCGISICYCNTLKWREICVILLLLLKLLPENLIESIEKAAMKRKAQAIFHSLFYGWHTLHQSLFLCERQFGIMNINFMHVTHRQVLLLVIFPTVFLKIRLGYEVYFSCHILSMK